MKKLLKDQRGAIDLIILIILLILLLLLAAWIYYNNQKKQKATPAPQKTETPKAATPAKAEPDTTSWLNIDQFVVRGKNTAGVTLKYEIKNVEDYKTAYFTSSEQLALDPACTTSFGPGGTISQYSAGTDYANGQKIENVTSAKKIGNYYYIFNQPQAYCSVAVANQAKEAAIQAAVKNVLATLEVKP